MSDTITLAINGLGRIGRTILRQIALEGTDSRFRVAHLNDIAPLETIAYLLRFDSVFGPFPGQIDTDSDALILNGARIPFTRSPDLEVDLSGVDLLMECTGKVKTRAWAERGLERGAQFVLVSGPSPVADATVVLGANEALMAGKRIISNASCTTNALAPLFKAMDDAWGIETAHSTTIHCYTGSQPMIDAPRDDLARSRAGALSMVPTTTSATGLVDQVLPHLAGRITGAAVRVPTASVSAVDIVLQARNLPDDATAGLKELVEASPVMGWTEWPNVSSDLRARRESVIMALPETKRSGAHQLRVFGWYDNEWGFSARMLDMAQRFEYG